MKTRVKGCALLLCLVQAQLTLFAQASSPDEGMDMFLLAILAIFFSVLIGAAIVGAFIACVVLFFLFGLMGIGVLSASIAIGLYKRSYTSGLKTFLIILFGLSCGFIGGFGIVAFSSFFHMDLSTGWIFFIGLTGGMIGGALVGWATFKISRVIIKYLINRFDLRIPI
jgi:hypothetical protein